MSLRLVPPTAAVERLVTTEALLVQLGLGPAWSQALEAELTANGISPQAGAWNTDMVDGWRRRTLADGDLLTLREYRLLAMRVASFAPMTIRERAHGRTDRATFGRLGLTLALRYTHGLEPLHPGRAGHRLLTKGPDWQGDPPRVVRRTAEQLWLAGAARQNIATACGLGPAALARVIEPLPARLTSGMVTARFGWSADNVFQKVNRGTFPPPDGFDGPSRQVRWWWATTIDEWAADRNLVTCPQCDAQVERLTTHQRAHA